MTARKWVPLEPTLEMLNAGAKFSLTLADAYKDMVYAAPDCAPSANGELTGQLREAAECMVRTYRDWMAGGETRANDVMAAHIHLRDTLANRPMTSADIDSMPSRPVAPLTAEQQPAWNDAVDALRKLVRLKHIKDAMGLGEATREERIEYANDKLEAWMRAFAIIDGPVAPRVEPRLDFATAYGDKLADWCNFMRPALVGMMEAYERRVRSECTPEQLDAKPWECMEYVAAQQALAMQPLVFVDCSPEEDKR